jgi:hypothetical protein
MTMDLFQPYRRKLLLEGNQFAVPINGYTGTVVFKSQPANQIHCTAAGALAAFESERPLGVDDVTVGALCVYLLLRGEAKRLVIGS